MDPFNKELKTTSPSTLKKVGNIIWFIPLGFIFSIASYLIGLIWNIADAGKPIANQFFKDSQFIKAPFGKEFVETKHRRHQNHHSQQNSSFHSETE